MANVENGGFNMVIMYAAIRKRKNGKVDFSYGCEEEPERIFRNLSEFGVLKQYDVAAVEFTVKKILPNNESYYWNEEEK